MQKVEDPRVEPGARCRLNFAHPARVRAPAKQHKLIDIITIAQRTVAVACLEKFPKAGNKLQGLFATVGNPQRVALSHYLCRNLWGRSTVLPHIGLAFCLP